MKNLTVITLLVFSGLTLNSQNLITNQVLINTSHLSNNQQFNHDNSENNVVVQMNSQSARNSFGNARGNRATVIQTQHSTPNKVKQIKKNPVNTINYVAIDNVNGNDNPPLNNQVNIQSNPVQVNTVKVDKPEKKVDVPVGLDFTPSGLSGRDYSNGGKLKKGEKNFYTQSTKRPVTKIKKRKPSGNKKSYKTHSCAKWKA